MAAPSLTENSELRHLIEERIDREGPITFADFMELALYHPELGYYTSTRQPMGADFDYVTSPEVSRLFGFTLARHVIDNWRAAGAPENWTIVELGPGTGRLALDILDALGAVPELASTVSYTLVESSETLRQQQKLVLRRYGDKVHWFSTVDELPGDIQGHVLTNEFFDALPVHRVTIMGGELKEIHVGRGEDGRTRDVVCEPSTPRLAGYFESLGLLPAEGAIAEVNLGAVDVMAAIARRLSLGLITTLDYGYEATELYAPWRRQGTLLCFYGQAYSDQPYQRIGRQDITSHVDFTSLANAATKEGLQIDPLLSQMEFLAQLGIGEGLREEGVSLEEALARRRAVQTLVDPARLGRIRVLVARR